MSFEYYESYFSLDLPSPQLEGVQFDWKRYNPRKDVLRWGVSLTSLDGGEGGIPDLDSLYEFNKIHGTNYRESDFNVPTQHYTRHFQFLDNYFEMGRSHILKLGTGGFFPYHRDFDDKTFRLIYTLSGCEESNFVWIQNDKLLKLKNHTWYYINTKMVHSVFTFFGCEFAVFNPLLNDAAKNSLVHLLSTK